MQPNLFATIALAAWPLVSLWLYRTFPIGRATLWTILAAFLLLPSNTSIKFEGFPALDKNSIPSFGALVGCLLVLGSFPRIFYGFRAPELLIVLMIVGPFLTSLENFDPLHYGPVSIPGSSYYDALSASVTQFILFAPFFIGRHLLRAPRDIEDLFRMLVIAGLCYSLPMLFEVRMSPQLHTWVYGYFPHSFGQQMRQEGFRPVVFMNHGLVVAFFSMTTVAAASAMWRARTAFNRLPMSGVTAYLAAVLFLCKSLGALFYGLVLVALIRLTSPRFQLRIALLISMVALLYPALRTWDLFPARALVGLAQTIDTERAQSLQSRFDNEERLLDKARERLFLGWGRFGRSRIYDTETGADLSVTDGRWVITLGQFGLVGFLAEFGLLAIPIWRAWSVSRANAPASDLTYLAALSLIVAVSLVDLLPNALLNGWTWLLAGALLGRAEALASPVRANGAERQQLLS